MSKIRSGNIGRFHWQIYRPDFCRFSLFRFHSAVIGGWTIVIGRTVFWFWWQPRGYPQRYA